MTISFLSQVHEKEKVPFSFLTKHALFKNERHQVRHQQKKLCPKIAVTSSLAFQ